MSSPANTTTTTITEPAVDADVPVVMQNPPVDAADSKESIAEPPAATETTPAVDHVVVLALGDVGEILAAGDASLALFGWAPGDLVDRNIRILLKDGLDNDFGRFLLRYRVGLNPTGTSDLRVLALRKDGSEFPAQVTTQACNCDTTSTKKGHATLPRWTAAFRELEVEAKPVDPAPTDVTPAAEVPPGKPQEDLPKEAAAPPPPDSPLPELAPEPKELPASPAAEPIAVLELKQRIAELEDQLHKATADLANAKTEAEKLGCHASELQGQLDASMEATGYTQAALSEEIARREKLDERLRNLREQLSLEQAERRQRFEEELVGLREERDGLSTLLAAEQQAADKSTRRAQELEACLCKNAVAFEQVKTELERQNAEREQSESAWREQLDTAWVAKKNLEGAWAEAVEHNRRFEEDLATLRREHDELSQKMAAEQKAAADSKERAKELESRLGRNAADSDRARTELEKQIANREQADAEWRKQLDAVNALKTNLESSLTEATERIKRLEEEQSALRQERDELQNRLKAEQQTALEAGQRADGLQRHVDQNTAEVERLVADLKKQNTEREQAEARAREQQQIAQTLATKLEAGQAEVVERNTGFEEERAELRAERDELALQLKAQQQTSTDGAHQIAELQRRLERITTELNQVSAKTEKKRSKRDSAHSERPAQLEPAKALARKRDAAWTGGTERTQPMLDQSTPPAPAQLPAYTFGAASNTPARRKRSLSKQRLQP